jgi:hypothetical protein
MKNRKLNLKRLLIVLGIPCGICLLILFGWLLTKIPGFEVSPSYPMWANYFGNGIIVVVCLAVIFLFCMGIWEFFNWLFPKEN